MAALRAKTIQSKTNINLYQENGSLLVVTPKKNPIIAKGKANTECANNTSEKYFFIDWICVVREDTFDKCTYSDLLAE